MSYKLGKILTEHNILSHQDIDAVLRFQAQTGGSFGECLNHLNLCSREEFYFGFSKHLEEKAKRRRKGMSLSELSELLRRVGQHKGLLTLITLGSLLAGALSATLIVPFLAGQFVEYIIPLEAADTGWRYFLLGALALFVGCLINFLSCCGINVLVSRVCKGVLADAVSAVHRWSYALFSRFDKGDLLSRLSQDIENVSNQLRVILLISFQNIFQFVFALAFLLFVNVWLTLLCLPLIVLFSVVPALASRGALPFLNVAPEKLGRITSLMRELLANALFARSNNRQEAVAARVGEAVEAYYQKNFHIWFFWNLSHNLKISLGHVMSLVILWVGANFVMSDAMSVGALITFYLIVYQLITKIGFVTGLYIVLQDLKANWIRLQYIFDLPEEQRQPKASSEPCHIAGLSFDNVEYRYSVADAPVFRGLNVHLKAGEHYALLGRSGAGKTTFLKLAAGLLLPFAGQLRVGEHNTVELSREQLWRNVAYMDQEVFVFHNRSVRDNIAIGAADGDDNSEAAVIAAARHARIHERIMELPRGYDSIFGEDAFSLSTGEMQRLALARTLMRAPELLVLDEPTASLDSTTADEIADTVLHLPSRPMVLYSTHHLPHLRKFRNVIVFEEGCVRLIENDPVAIEAAIERFRDTLLGAGSLPEDGA